MYICVLYNTIIVLLEESFFDSAIILLLTLRGRAREEQVSKTSQFK